MSQATHIVIIGGGPGGYVAGLRAAQLGGRVTVVEEEALGGVCLNWGCIPSKTLLGFIELGERVRHAQSHGLKIEGDVSYDLARMVSRKNDVVKGLVKGISTLFKQGRIEYIPGRGELVDNRRVKVTSGDGKETNLDADAIVLATGSSWPDLPQFPVDGRRVITSKQALDLTEIPERILIVGAGVEGCEFATLFSGLGAQVSMVEMMPAVLPLEDEETSAVLTRELKKRKVQIYLETTIAEWSATATGVKAILSSGEEVMADALLVSVGRRMNSARLGLETVGVEIGGKGEIVINERMETNVPGIYAIGDVTGKSMLAHVASAQGKVAVANALGANQPMNYDVVPAGIFTLPEIGRVGLTEQQTRERGLPVTVGKFRYAGLGKAQALGETAGHFKIIAHAETQTILGVHIIGAHAADLIHEAALAMFGGVQATELAEMIHAHPTLSEGLMEAAEDLEGMAIHQARKA
jgi:dihydrolipoamide dehydrogenase